MNSTDKKFHLFLLFSIIIILIWSGIRPYSRYNWFFEVFSCFIIIATLLFTYNKFKFSNLVYTVIWLALATMAIGGHYYYKNVPFFNYLKNVFHLSRNHFDRLGHIIQGAVPALVTAELLIRKKVLKNNFFIFIISFSVSIAISALYEIGEVVGGYYIAHMKNDFLQMQGDQWDTQWDMLCAAIGAFFSLTALSPIHWKILRKKFNVR
ncbi:hypothetical protein U732_3988 [Clostridium argentinense CDC 2741]|uniref:Inner membrane protein yjdF n=1 Tax=Clostridium argentinense CDC 2741 TaxID=1418104 RepID=A0A0C1RCW7_9CLOT|nr:DUF2238 domain-containing protein [Clostridium argentinense]ARC84790.1 hypothetical protein RSJ17_09785 [Clostridium argentinense]KIE48216.1 hypothetical protein U732_3988 [Clostridium argentinense CDC 2741]NFF41101.1 DUF2238 domain-containing protein [Clostridium argentinense]NFP52158.1 DUF2238 domain-containing protein [Clostridium argentinense]NFP74549.1 DUF2238 domain-containing protein [Clostridium argentinense]